MIKAIIFDFFGVLVTEGFKQFREVYFSEDSAKDQGALSLIKQNITVQSRKMLGSNVNFLAMAKSYHPK